jgi:hypothetical protein
MNNLSVHRTIIGLSAIALTKALAYGAPPIAPPPPPAVTTPVKGTGVGTESPAVKAYNYVGDRYRDPFVPLLGEGRMDTGSEAPPPISSLVLKGIVQDSHGRVALLSSGASSYVLRAGRLYDGRNRIVKKISGVVKTDSVVIIGSDRTVRELRAKNTL